MIVEPNQMDFSDQNITILIFGAPGTGKSTLGCSLNNPLVVDTDNGTVRVDAAHRVDTSFCKTYEEINADLEKAKGKYESLVIDTGGAFVSFLKEWVKRNEPTATKKGGGFSYQGYGFVLDEFNMFAAEARKWWKVTCFLFHEATEKRGEEIFYSILCEGNAKTTVWNNCTVGARLFIQNGERYLGFSPTDEYNAKSTSGIKGLIKVPELKEGDVNDFLARLVDKIRQQRADNAKAFSADKAKYDAAMKRGLSAIKSVTAPELVEPCIAEIDVIEHALTSKKELLAALKEQMKKVGIVYDKVNKVYTVKE